MAEVRPFRALRYNGEKIKDFSCVMAPPYDVISEEMQEELYSKDPHNIIRLILGKDLEGDNAEGNKYTRAKSFMDEWIKDGVLLKEEEEAFYIYEQEYDIKGQKYRRRGFLGLMRIEGEEMVVPHEKTHSKPKEDRLNLIQKVESNLSPIFTLYDDEGRVVKEVLYKAVSSEEAIIDIVIGEVRHKLWRLSDPVSVEKIRLAMKDKKVFIADGHHRYEVARTYRDLKRKEDSYDGRADNVLMFFADMLDADNLTVLATHRVLKDISGLSEEKIIEKLSVNFELTECASLEDLMEKLEENSHKPYFYGFFGGTKYIMLQARKTEALKEMMDESKKDEWKELDVSLLHSALLDNILALKDKEGNITYVKEPGEGVSLVEEGSHSCVFFLNPTKLNQLKNIAEAGEVMPQKSTFFYPKLLTGLVINKFEKTEAKVK